MSSRVNIGQLVEHINSLPETYYYLGHHEHPSLHPNLKFKILYSITPPSSTTTALPPIKQHFPESFFSFDVSTEELKKIQSQSQSLHGKVQAKFTNKLSAYASLLQRKTFRIPEDVLYVLFPFLHGDALTEPMLNDIVAAVRELMGTTTTTTSSSETTKKKQKKRKSK